MTTPDAAEQRLVVGASSVATGSLPAALRDLYHELSFGGVVQECGFAWSDIDEWRHQYDRLSEELWSATRNLDPTAKTAERNTLTKNGVNFRFLGYGAAVAFEALKTYDRGQAAILAPELAAIGRSLVDAIARMGATQLGDLYWGRGVPVAKGKGAPFWLGASDSDLAGALTALALASRSVAHLQEITAHPRWSGLVLTTYIRVQANKRPGKRVVKAGGALIRTDGAWTGPKVRRVTAASFVLNCRLIPLAYVMKAVEEVAFPDEQPGNPAAALRIARRYAFHLASDMTSYDECITDATRVAWRELVLEPFLRALYQLEVITYGDYLFALDADEWLDSAPLLSPPRYEGEDAELVPMVGRNKSGEAFTSRKATQIRRAQLRTKRRRLGILDTTHSFNFGDDGLVMGNRAFDWPTLVDEVDGVKIRDFQFEEEVAAYSDYLMRGSRTGYAQLCRMTTLNSEPKAEPRDPLEAAVRLRARYDLLCPRVAVDKPPPYLNRPIHHVQVEGHPAREAYFPALRAAYDGNPVGLAAVELAQARSTRELAHLIANSRHPSPALQAMVEGWVEGGLMTAEDVTELLGDDWEEYAGTHRVPWRDLVLAAGAVPVRESLTQIHARVNQKWSRKTMKKRSR